MSDGIGSGRSLKHESLREEIRGSLEFCLYSGPSENDLTDCLSHIMWRIEQERAQAVKEALRAATQSDLGDVDEEEGV